MMKPDINLRTRLIVVDIMIPILLLFAFLGGWPFTIFVAGILAVAATEFWKLFKNNGFSPSLPVMVLFVPAVVILRHFYQFSYSDLWLALLILVAMFWHVLSYQKGIKTAATDFTVTVGGVVYLGWLGSYAVTIRDSQAGIYWLLLILPIISLADSGAYLLGRAFGKHKMLPRVSPNKSWEGYLGGILTGTLGGWGLASMWHIVVPSLLPVYGIILGVIISTLAPFGDFGESMIKRQFNVKDSGTLLLIHGGFLDRVDSSLWAVAIGYYLMTLLTG